MAAALGGDPAVLILDEPTVGLDPVQQQAFRALLADLAGERTVLLSSHLMAEVDSSCDWLVMIAGGRLVASGSREEILGRGTSLVRVRVAENDLKRFEGVCRNEVLIDSVVRGDGRQSGVLQIRSTSSCDTPLQMGGELAGRHRITLHELREASTSLEEIFLQHAGPTEGDWSMAPSGEDS